jgi:hypothetical protein
MNEHVLTAAFGSYEAVTLEPIEPDHESACQNSSGNLPNQSDAIIEKLRSISAGKGIRLNPTPLR